MNKQANCFYNIFGEIIRILEKVIPIIPINSPKLFEH